jgi:NAD(P)H-hydrate repair Nnr-like enzyme with NAD(P)H-hydrate dehydratase domain
VVLVKVPATVVARSRGRDADAAGVRIVTSGSPSLATAGTGDVLSGAIGAFIARGTDPFEAAALAAHVHGRAAGLGPAEGLIAEDLSDLIAKWLSSRVDHTASAGDEGASSDAG